MPEIHIRPISAGSEDLEREFEERLERKREADAIRANHWATPSMRIAAAQTYWHLGDRVTARRMDEQTFGSSTGSYSDGPAAFILVCIALVIILVRWVLG